MHASPPAPQAQAVAADTPGAVRRAIPLARRRGDLIFLAFFIVNLGFIPYIVDIEQLIIAHPVHFQYPFWPPAPLVDLAHCWGRTYDPPLAARPPRWNP